ncbi:type 1 fimbria pilin [Sinobacterium caligoides]|uniref:Type 1 fimbria pilin n=1 Tax=Sinobacterium caligoides TaxID=933926 RepID=A0A3N2DMQ8_9GAMM|nr:fimbrial protein [Sinobacterium caligoides]ROS01070.1 type 1 fimbria pilin [Sinobacterium caligoides]
MYLVGNKFQCSLVSSLFSALFMALWSGHSLAASCQVGQPLQQAVGIITPAPGAPVGTLLSTTAGSSGSTVLMSCVSDGRPQDIYVESAGDTVMIDGRTITNIGDSGIGFAVKVQAEAMSGAGHAGGMRYLGERRGAKDDTHTTVLNTVDLPAGKKFSIHAQAVYEFYKTKKKIKPGVYQVANAGSIHLEGESAASDIGVTGLKVMGTCTIIDGTHDQSIELGKYPLDTFSGIGTKTPTKHFTIKMDCSGKPKVTGALRQIGDWDDVYGDPYTFRPTNYDGKGDRGIGVRVELQGKGLGAELIEHDEPKLLTESATNEFILDLNAYYYQFRDTIIPGDIDANLQYVFTFE